jgi:hypothetical protein
MGFSLSVGPSRFRQRFVFGFSVRPACAAKTSKFVVQIRDHVALWLAGELFFVFALAARAAYRHCLRSHLGFDLVGQVLVVP